MRHYPLLSCLLALSLGLQAQAIDTAALTRLLDAMAANGRGMGSLSIMQGDSLVYQHAVGYASIERQQPNTPNTAFRIGSISKTFTACIILQMVEEGRLRLDAPLADFFPDIPNAGRISIRHLLGHRSGIHSFTDDDDYYGWYTQPQSQAAMLARIAEDGSDFEPGSRAEYSNANYLLLGYIAEAVDGSELASIVQRRIAGPLGLGSTRYGGPIDPDADEARSYADSGTWELENETHMSVPGGAGALVATPADLCRFFRALGEGRVVADSSLALMRQWQDGFGLGLFPFPFYDKESFGHNGGIDGFSSVASYFPAEGLAIAYCSNGESYPMNDLMIGVLNTVFGKPAALPDFGRLLVDSEVLSRYEGRYTSDKFPLAVRIARKGNLLNAQAEGQSAFTLDALSDSEFEFAPAGIRLSFDPDKAEMRLQQSGMDLTFKKAAE